MGKIEFTCVIAFARFCAELTRQGIAYNGHERTNGEFIVTLTGF